jgi:hypothetical protein
MMYNGAQTGERIMKLLRMVCLGVLVVAAGCATFSASADLYREGMRNFNDGRLEFAVLSLSSLIKEDLQSPYAPQSAFAVGEYFFDKSDGFNSLKTLSDYIHAYPKHKGVIFAKLIIYKMLIGVKNEETLGVQERALIQEIRKELFSQPLFLIFYDKKAPRSYKSLFKHTYLVYDYVDKIKVFRDDKIFLELSP